MGRHAGIFQTRIGGHKANFVDPNASRTGDSGFQLKSEFGRLGFAGGKSMNETSELFFGDCRRKLDAGETCR